MRVRTMATAGTAARGSARRVPGTGPDQLLHARVLLERHQPGMLQPDAGPWRAGGCHLRRRQLHPRLRAERAQPWPHRQRQRRQPRQLRPHGHRQRSVLAGAMLFTLAIQQTDPDDRYGHHGRLDLRHGQTDPDFSSLIWTPSPSVVNIDGTSYRLIFDNIGPAAGSATRSASTTPPTRRASRRSSPPRSRRP